jgi:Tfp pilus assembly protein PilO
MGIRSWIGFAVIIVICALLLVANATVYQPRRERLQELNRELAVTETEHAYVAGHSMHLERILDFLPERSEEANGGGEQQFLEKISERLQDAGMVLTRVEPQRVRPFGSYMRRGFKFEVEGRYRDFANFLRYLELMPDVVVVESFEIKSKQLGGKNRHSATLMVTVIGQ